MGDFFSFLLFIYENEMKLHILCRNMCGCFILENETLRGVLPKNYSRPELDKRIPREIVDLFTNINIGGTIEKEKINAK